MTITVRLLIIEHKYGRNMSAHGDDEDAKRALTEYVRGEWPREMGAAEAPTSEGEMILDYFDSSEESWSIEQFDITNARWDHAASVGSAIMLINTGVL